jgi:hypothetical protein
VDPKNRAWLLIATLTVLIGGSIGGAAWYRARPIAAGMMIKRLPVQDSVVLYIDFAELRRDGILELLGGSKTSEDPDYQNFARKINFDYREDLDVAMVSFAPSGKYMLVKGRFDWKSLRTYAIEAGGKCMTALCRMTGSSPERRISFFPVQSSLMALAVSSYESAVLQMSDSPSGPPVEVPNTPIWLSMPGSLLKSGENLPSGTKMFARGMEKAEHVTLTFAPEGSHVAARLEVRCANEPDAVMVASQLASATLTLKQMMEREHQNPGPAELAGILASGSFRSEGRMVFGYWPVERAFMETVLGGVS